MTTASTATAATTATMGAREANRATKRVNTVLTRVMDDGGVVMTLVRVILEERGWPVEVWERIAKECMSETENEDNEVKGFNADDSGDNDAAGDRGPGESRRWRWRPVHSRRWWISER
mmetsp:Transcript_12532/g.22700  ORF Transcript_12532/g.22700 Transcript_12532/m.22700 type:complete len:118 (+) Transcript_12532:834-1187(+)